MKHLADSTPKQVDALPAPPQKLTPTLQQKHADNASSMVPLKGAAKHLINSDATWVQKVILVTRDYIESLVSPFGGITYRGLRLIGEPVPWHNGWRNRPVGTTVVVDEGELAAELELVRKKRAGEKIEKPRKTRDTNSFSDEEIQHIVELAKSQESTRKIAIRYKAPRGVIREILRSSVLRS